MDSAIHGLDTSIARVFIDDEEVTFAEATIHSGTPERGDPHHRLGDRPPRALELTWRSGDRTLRETFRLRIEMTSGGQFVFDEAFVIGAQQVHAGERRRFYWVSEG